MTRRLGPRLRPRLVLAFAAVGSLSAVAVAAASYLLVRSDRLDRATDEAVRQARFNLELLAERIGDPVTPQAVVAANEDLLRRGGFDVVTLDAGEPFLTTSVELAADSVPADLRDAVEGGRVAEARRTVADRSYVIVGGQLPPDGPSWFFFFPLDDVDEDLAGLRNVLAAVAVTTVVVAGVVGLVAARRLLRPVARARDAARRLEAGALDTRLPADGSDEFAELSRSFNAMAVALERTVGDLRELEANQRRFVADVSHELRTPLTALTTAADVLAGNRAGLNEPGARAAGILVLEAHRLRRLVEDLMEISRFDAGVASVDLEPVPVGRVVRESAALRGWSGEVEVTVDGGDGGGEVWAAADARRLDTIVANLLGNAVKHGRPPVRATVASVDGRITVTVADAGPGIAAGDLTRVFERFAKGDAARPRSEGSGLGLAIARENARLLGGDITAASPPGSGAVFTLTLPVAEPLPGGDVVATGAGDHGDDRQGDEEA
jgi:two-component system, OmpR family, sensor histidine kinase MtrB